MRVRRESVVAVLVNAVKFFARLLHRIDVNDNIRKITDVMHRFTLHFLGDGVTLFHRKLRRDRHVYFGV